jgi:two-component system, OmpR family, alkaline phosphatase synthesis response regulator PhoP
VSFPPSSIVFLDNSVNRIFKTVETLRVNFPGIHVFDQEKEFWEFITAGKVDVFFLHLDISPNDGIYILRELRQAPAFQSSFIVIYSDKHDDFVQELAFNAGADSFIGYHTKPSIMKLFLRNLLRRRQVRRSVLNKDVRMDTEKYLIYKEGTPVQLPRKEFMIFELLYNSSGKFISKVEIATLVWKDEAVAKRRTIDVHIYNIRQAFGRKIIQSKKGFGYRMNKKVAGI